MEFTPENKARFERILQLYPVKRSALLPALQIGRASCRERV